jgi:hypothetical protein
MVYKTALLRSIVRPAKIQARNGLEARNFQQLK